jgi:hypothetical protein
MCQHRALMGTFNHSIENNASEKMRKALATKRNRTSSRKDRVKGSGPDRKQLEAYKLLTSMPEEVITELIDYFNVHKDQNDLRSPRDYPISHLCPLKEALPDGFRHRLLTHCAEGAPNNLEWSYTAWTKSAKDLIFYQWFQEAFPGAFRVRLSLLAPKTEFSWHIDTNTSVACRCSANLTGEGAIFEIKKAGKIQRVPMKAGEVFFTNTGWPHRVINPTDRPRLNLVFGTFFENIEHFFSTKEDGSFY